MKDLGRMMQQVQEMQTRMQEFQARLEGVFVTGNSGGGLVSVTLNGKGAMSGCSIDASLIQPEEKEIIEDLFVAAHSDARDKLEKLISEEMKQVTGGIPLPPGFQLPM
ncbi:MAG TPA: YbaB/EbfC family nucleoid-associated protein [Aestuariivirgaceae bacterium]|nr:YbaB/EbfC family nucleoid-associated protein [Aestuariivirgaceae bacterium]